jgi:hypothetical protein
MAARFHRGATAYAKDGRSYVVDDVDDGIVYCSSSAGAEMEFPEAALMTEAEWAARSDGRRDLLYMRLKQARAYGMPTGRLDRVASEQVLAKVERLSPGILDFTAFTVATRIMQEAGDRDLIPGLSIPKCREVFDAAKPEVRASLLAGVLGTQPDALVGAGRLGDNLMRAILDKGLAASAVDYENFRDRRRI